MTLQLRYAAHSEIGLVRKNNQDSGYASPRLLVVADGMGGAAAGDLASAVAIQQLRRADRGADAEPAQGEEMLELLAGALHNANEKIADLVADDHMLEGMGTTVSAMLFDGTQLGLVHIGDSRAYRVRDDRIERLTHDHSWVQSLVDEGKLTAEEAAYHPHRSLLLKVLNGQPAADPDTALVDVQAGDRLLLCSDGLCGLVEDDELLSALTSSDDLQAVLDVLIDAAHREGGVDNITIILADVVKDPDQAAAEDSTDETGDEPRAEAEIPTVLFHFQEDPKVVGAAMDRTIPVVAPRDDDEVTIRRDRPEESAEDDEVADEPVEVDEEEIRYAPRLRPRRGGALRVVIAIVLIGALIGGCLGAGYAWSRTQYFVGPADDYVAIHQGLAQNVLGVPLSEVQEIQYDILLADLPRVYRERVIKTIPAHSLEEARTTTAELKVEADRCIAQRRAREEAARATPPPGEQPPGEQPPGEQLPGEPADPEDPAAPGDPAPGDPAPGDPAPGEPEGRTGEQGAPAPADPQPLTPGVPTPLDPNEDC